MACKAFRKDEIILNAAELKEKKLTRHLFKKEYLPSHNPENKFTFWEWFYSMLQLTEQHMCKIWAQGFVIGFINKMDAESFLLDRPPGTFLLRFSDSTKGGVTIGSRQPEPCEYILLIMKTTV